MSNLERTLQDAWFRAQGIGRRPDEEIHPEDDMYRWEGVVGNDPAWLRALYMRGGHEAVTVLANALSAAGKELGGVRSLLDFACGYGRSLRFLVGELPPERIWASDVLPGAVAFARERFGVHGVPSHTDPERVAFDRRFEVIWVGSLFSHLPRRRFGQFLARLFALLEPDGVLVFSTHGDRVLPGVPKDPSGFTFRPESESEILDGAEYGGTFVAPRIVHELAREVGIEHLWHLEQDVWRIQDVFVASPRALVGMDSWSHSPVVRGSVERLEREPSGDVLVGGWVRVPRAHHPLEEIWLRIDDDVHLGAIPLAFQGELPASEGGDAFRQTDWYLRDPLDGLARGTHALCVGATCASGLRGAFAARALDVG